MRIGIPARRSPLRMAVLAAWLAAFAWVVSGSVAALLRPDPDQPVALMVLWLVTWGIGAAAAAGSLAWMLWGREVVDVAPGSLSVRRQIGPLGRTRRFDLAKVSNLRSCAAGVEFEYGSRRERFASGLGRDAAEELAARIMAALG